MPGFTNYAEQKLLDHFFRGIIYTPPTTIYAGLLASEPLEDGSGGDEPVGLGGYTRPAISFGSYATRRIAASNDAIWSATVDWGDFPHLGLFDAPTAGNMLMSTGSIDLPGSVGLVPVPTINAGGTFLLAAGEIILEILAAADGQSGCSPYLAQRMLELMFKNTAHPTFATKKAHLATTAPTPDGTGGSWLVAADYTPPNISFGAFNNTIGGMPASADIFYRGASGGAWGDLKAWAVFDGLNTTTDHMLYTGPIVPMPTVGAAAPFSLLGASTTIRIN
jgi:hypothetical protein